VDKAVTSLTQRHLADHLFGHPCKVTEVAQLQDLWDAAAAHFGQVDIWINNVGISHPLLKVWEMPKEMMDSVVATNLMGTLYGSEVAIRGMLAQGNGHYRTCHQPLCRESREAGKCQAHL
jgi:NAD(P)-dependent dehydrogenase (short-subunit alcohol dehydrogenase family)